MKAPLVSLVIPCFNEAQSLPELVGRCAELTRNGDFEVVLVDNGSTDETPQLLETLLSTAPGCRSVGVAENRGYGHGILAGLEAARGEWLAWTHADLQADVMDLRAAAQLAAVHGPQVYVKGKRQGRAAADVAFTVGMSIFETVLMRQPLWDINAQPNLFHRNFFLSWRNPPMDFSLDLYAYAEARRQHLRVIRFPVNFGARKFGRSHWNLNWRSKWTFIKRTIAFSFQLRKALSRADH